MPTFTDPTYGDGWILAHQSCGDLLLPPDLECPGLGSGAWAFVDGAFRGSVGSYPYLALTPKATNNYVIYQIRGTYFSAYEPTWPESQTVRLTTISDLGVTLGSTFIRGYTPTDGGYVVSFIMDLSNGGLTPFTADIISAPTYLVEFGDLNYGMGVLLSLEINVLVRSAIIAGCFWGQMIRSQEPSCGQVGYDFATAWMGYEGDVPDPIEDPDEYTRYSFYMQKTPTGWFNHGTNNGISAYPRRLNLAAPSNWAVGYIPETIKITFTTACTGRVSSPELPLFWGVDLSGELIQGEITEAWTGECTLTVNVGPEVITPLAHIGLYLGLYSGDCLLNGEPGNELLYTITNIEFLPPPYAYPVGSDEVMIKWAIDNGDGTGQWVEDPLEYFAPGFFDLYAVIFRTNAPGEFEPPPVNWTEDAARYTLQLGGYVQSALPGLEGCILAVTSSAYGSMSIDGVTIQKITRVACPTDVDPSGQWVEFHLGPADDPRAAFFHWDFT